MKTIDEAANDYVKNKYEEFALLDIIGEDTSIKDLRNDFIAGAEFAQQFINIEDEKPEYYEPVIIELQNGGVIAWRGWSETYGDTYTINGTDIYLMAKEVKRWRPINFK